MAKYDCEYIVYYDTDTKIVQGKNSGIWGEKDGVPDSDGISRLRGYEVHFGVGIMVYPTDDYSAAAQYIVDNNLIIPEE